MTPGAFRPATTHAGAPLRRLEARCFKVILRKRFPSLVGFDRVCEADEGLSFLERAMKRIVKIPFLYEAKITPPGYRKPNSYAIRENADFELNEVTSSDVPIAMEWIQNDSAIKYNIEKVNTMVTRVFDGRVYTRMINSDKPFTITQFETDVAQPRDFHTTGYWAGKANKAKWSARDFPTLKLDRLRDAETLTAFELDEAIAKAIRDGSRGSRARLVSHNREARLAATTPFYETSFLVVDGEMWTTQWASEPHYTVRTWRFDSDVKIEVGCGEKPLAYISPFRADRYEDALAYARDVAAARGLGPDAVKTTSDVLKIHRPDLLVRDDGVELAEQMIEGLGMNISNRNVTLPGRAESAFQKLFELRRSETRDIAWAAEVFAATEALYADMPELPETKPGEIAGDIDSTFNNMRPAFDRWMKFERSRRSDIVHLMKDDFETEDELPASLSF